MDIIPRAGYYEFKKEHTREMTVRYGLVVDAYSSLMERTAILSRNSQHSIEVPGYHRNHVERAAAAT